MILLSVSCCYCCSVTHLCFDSLQPHGLQDARLPCPSLSSWNLLKLMSIELVMPSNHLILCRPLLLLPSIFPSIRVFSNESALRIRWPKYWSFSFNISRSSEHSGLISFRMDWLDLLAVQGTLKSHILWINYSLLLLEVKYSCHNLTPLKMPDGRVIKQWQGS